MKNVPDKLFMRESWEFHRL